MVSSKTEIKRPNSEKTADVKKPKKRKLKRLYWLLAHLVAATVIVVLLLYKPGRYHPIKIDPAQGRQVSTYLTHDLLAPIHNAAQPGEPFDLTVTQEGINDIIARSRWPRESGDARFSAPAVLFVPDSIVLMGTVALKGVEFVVTIVLEPTLDEQGLLNLRAAKLKVGAMNITLLAKVIAKRMYQQRIEAVPIDKEDIGAKIAASLLNDEPFDPVFEIEGDKLRIEKVTIRKQELILHLIPLPD